MTMSGDAQQRIEAYLGRLRQRLRGMNDEDAREIVEELRSHITDKAAADGEITAAGVDAALAALGNPEELASQYTTDNLLARAEVSRSPARILESLFRWASLLRHWIFFRSCFHSGGSVETVSSAHRGIVDFSRRQRRFTDFFSTWIRKCTGGRQGSTRLVDRADRVDGRLRPRDVDHLLCDLVRAAIPKIALIASKLIWPIQRGRRGMS
jgi:hypothetical protein